MSKMFNPPHPGRILKSALEALDISARSFAKHIDVSPATITRVIRGEIAISPTLAVKLAKAISGPDADMWLRMQATYDAWQAEHSVDVTNITPYPYLESSVSEHRIAA